MEINSTHRWFQRLTIQGDITPEKQSELVGKV
jgi:hypothetical protein